MDHQCSTPCTLITVYLETFRIISFYFIIWYNSGSFSLQQKCRKVLCFGVWVKMAASLLLDHVVTGSFGGEHPNRMLPWHCLLRMPIDCIKTAISVCIDCCAAGQAEVRVSSLRAVTVGDARADSGVEVMLSRGQIEAQPLVLSAGSLVLMQSADVC